MDLFYLIIENFNVKQDSKYTMQHKASRYLLEYIAKNIYNIENTEIETINKKPKFKYSNIEFSISHCENIVCVCFDNNPVGFDIEKIIQRDYKKISQRMHLELKEDTLNEFYRCWTIYEAGIKLQKPITKSFSSIFLDKYFISAVSNETADINLKITQIKSDKITF